MPRFVIGSVCGTIRPDRKLEKMLVRMTNEPAGLRFIELYEVCRIFFGEPRQAKGSHVVFKTPWLGDPRINIQNDGGRAKAYQVRQVLAALRKLEVLK